MSTQHEPLVLATLNFPPATGGIEQMCAELARELAALGVPLQVVAPSALGDAAFDAAAPYRITRYSMGPLRHLNLSREVARLLRSGHERVLFGQFTAAGLSVAGQRLARRPSTFVTFAYAKEMLRPARGPRATALFYAYRRAVLEGMSAVLAISQYTAEQSRRVGARNVHVVHPGVDAVRFTPGASTRSAEARASGEGPTLLSVGRLVRRKGFDTLLSALPALRVAHPGLRCLIAGDGEDRARLHALVAELGVSDRVVFLGKVEDDDLPRLYADADLFLLLSREDLVIGDAEGFGLVLLEAQASGTPVVVARSGGMPDALVPGETGILVAPDDPAGLALELGRLLGDEARLRTLSAAARRYACTQSWRAMAERALELIDTASRR